MNEFPTDLFLKNNNQANSLPHINSADLTKSQEIINKINSNLGSQDSSSKHKKSAQMDSLSLELQRKLKENGGIDENSFNAYFDNSLRIVKIKNDSIIFTTASNFIKNMIQDHFLEELSQAVFMVLGKKYEVSFQLEELEYSQNRDGDELGLGSQNKFESNSNGHKIAIHSKTPSFKLDLSSNSKDIESQIESKYLEHTDDFSSGILIDKKKTFDNFIIGPSNNMAYATALAVAKTPGKSGKYPSLYIHSNSGLGKTHLLHAVANGLHHNHPTFRICLITARDFMNELINMMQNNQLAEFRRKYSEKVDILMIDDIHELANKNSTQNEFFHIFNELHNKGKQLIFTSDKSPKEIIGIEERIKTRLQWGLVIDIQKPDFETRIAILKKKAKELDLFINDSIIILIANSIKSSIRELEGSLIRLSAFVDVMNVDIDEAIVKELLMLDEQEEKNDLSIDLIAKTTANYYKISLADLKSKARNKEITRARHVTMYLIRKLLNKTQQEIGMYFGGRDHTSVIHAVNKITDNLKNDPILSKDILTIENNL